MNDSKFCSNETYALRGFFFAIDGSKTAPFLPAPGVFSLASKQLQLRLKGVEILVGVVDRLRRRATA